MLDSPPGHKTHLVQVLGYFNSARYGFHLMEQDLETSKKWLVTPIVFVPLLQWVILSGQLCFIVQGSQIGKNSGDECF